MLSKTNLDQAKLFLCMDLYPDLSIKLIAIDKATAFFYPSIKDLSTIIVFYEKNQNDFTNPLFLLFHEVGHFEQYKAFLINNKVDEFCAVINLDKGTKKIQFEREAWNKGREIIEIFLEKYQIDKSKVIDQYNNFAENCLLSYK